VTLHRPVIAGFPVLFSGLLALFAGMAGFALVPDTGLYARSGFHLWPAPLSNLGGVVAGHVGVVVLSALAAGACVWLLPPGRGRWLFAGASAYWFCFPGVDALGLLFVLLALRSRSSSSRFLSSGVAAAVHPVALLTSWPALLRRDALGLAGVAVCTAGVIVAVGLLDGFSTTDRYALPLLALACSGSRS
jgi:hypothetical protein